MNGLHAASAVELEALYRSKAASPVDAMRAVLARIAQWEPHLNATYALDAEAALAQARASEARWMKGEALGPLDGVPVTIKENIATRGTPLPLGTAATELLPAAQDAPPAARLREAGAAIVCKTTMPDYGMLSSGLSSFHPLTRNPWDLTKNPGGSSAGAAAAAAAGYGPLHLGTDIGGSVRLPAGWCGIFTLKPSLGRIPIHPPYYGRVAGPMTRTVEDAALMMSVLSRPDLRDPTSLPWQDIDWRQLDLDVRGLKLALMMDAGWGTPVEPAVRAAIEAAARALEAAGAIVEPLAPFMTRAMIDGLDRFWRMRAWLDISRLSEARQARVLPYIAEWARGGAGLSGEAVFSGFSQMAAMRDAAVAACAPFDFVLSPTAPMPAFAAEWAAPSNDPQRPFEHIAFTVAFNMSEQPAASINAGYTADGSAGGPQGGLPGGLPIGLQLIGRRHDDRGVLQLARAWELMRPTPKAWPEPPRGLPQSAP